MPFWGRTFITNCWGIRVNGRQHPSDSCIDRPIVWRRGRGGAYKSLCTWRTFQDENLNYAAIELKGEIPSSMNPPSGCVFHTRCQYVNEDCKKIIPQLEKLNGSEHQVSCLRIKEI